MARLAPAGGVPRKGGSVSNEAPKGAHMKIPDNRANGFGDGSKATNNRLVKHNPTSATAQCTRLLSRLKQGPITTYEAMRMLDVYHVPARVLQLRKREIGRAHV